MMQFLIMGNPPVKKNSRSIARNPRTGRMYPIKSSNLRLAEQRAAWELKQQKREYPGLPLCDKLHVRFMFYRADRRKVDLSNLYEFAQDCLQTAGIIADDYQVESHDGSRRLYDKDRPRTEIFISPFVE